MIRNLFCSFLLLLILAFNHPVFSQIRDLSPGLSHVQNGDNKMRINDWEGAILEYTTAIKVDPDLADAYYKRSIVYTKMSHFREAEIDRTKALRMNPRIEKFYDERALLASLFIDQGNFEENILDAYILQPFEINVIAPDDSSMRAITYKRADARILDSLIAADPSDTIALLLRANLKLSQEDFNAAIEDADAVLELNVDNAKAYEVRGLLQFELGNFLIAVDELSRSIEILPTNATAYFNRGIARVIINDIQGALIDFHNAFRFDKKMWQAAYNAGILQMKNENFSNAVLDFENAISINNNVGYIYFYRGLSRYRISAFQGAYNDFEKSFQLGDYRPAARNNRAVMSMFLNANREAIEDLTEAVQEAPDYGLAYYNRGIANILTQFRLNACDDFKKSHFLGFIPALNAITDFCSN